MKDFHSETVKISATILSRIFAPALSGSTLVSILTKTCYIDSLVNSWSLSIYSRSLATLFSASWFTCVDESWYIWLSTIADRHISLPRVSAFISGFFIHFDDLVSSVMNLRSFIASIYFLKRTSTWDIARKNPRFTVWLSEFKPFTSLLRV